jgi:large subunit ribosomal protein L22
VGEGPTIKRMMPRARGSGSRILKRTSHIRIILSDEIAIDNRETRRAKKKQEERAARKAGEGAGAEGAAEKKKPKAKKKAAKK